MSEMIKSEGISRRKTLSLLGLAAVFGLVASTTVLAQTLACNGVMRGVQDASHDVTGGGITER